MSGINGTFGNTAAAVRLATFLAQDEKQMAKVGNLLSKFSSTLNELTKMDSRMRLGIAKIVMHHYKHLAENYPSTFNTYLSNVISMRYRIWLENQDSQTPYKFRKLTE